MWLFNDSTSYISQVAQSVQWLGHGAEWFGIRVPAGDRGFYVLQNAQHKYRAGPDLRRLGREFDHLAPSCTEIKVEWSRAPYPHMP